MKRQWRENGRRGGNARRNGMAKIEIIIGGGISVIIIVSAIDMVSKMASA
jgi:hypothetical protein